METTKKIVYKLMVCAMLLIAIQSGFFGKTSEMMQVQASEIIPDTTIQYDFNNGTLQIHSQTDDEMPDYTYVEAAPWSKYKDSIEKVVIKSSITHIGEWAFAGCSRLKEVEIDDPSLTSIGANAFYKCEQLEKINLPDSVMEIGAYAFGQCENLSDCNIPQNVKVLEDFVFYQCEKLDNVKLPVQLVEICDGAFAYCGSLKNVNLQDTNVARIGENAFLKTGIVEVVMPESLHTLGARAFEDCSGLIYVSLPKELNEIEEKAFLDCRALKELQCLSWETKDSLHWAENAFEGCGVANIYVFKRKENGVYNWFLENEFNDRVLKDLHDMANNDTNYSVQLLNESYSYTGTEICPEIQLIYSGKALKNTTDYILQYSDNINIGTATLKIIGRGAYAGSITKNYTIDKGDLEEKGKISDIPNQVYTGNPIRPTVTVTYDGKVLVMNTDYTISYLNNTLAGNQAIVQVSGVGNYKGTIEKMFSISAANTGGSTQGGSTQNSSTQGESTQNSSTQGESTQNGSTQGESTQTGSTQNSSTQHESTKNNSETKNSSVENTTSIKKCKIKVGSQIYTGKEIVPNITVKLGTKTLQKDVDYIILSCKNNKKVGTKATITIKGINQYKDQKTVKFKIIPPKAILKQKGDKVVVNNYYKGANVIIEIEHNGKKINGSVTATKYRADGGYPLYKAKYLYKGQKIKIRAKMSSGKKLQGKWSNWIKIK